MPGTNLLGPFGEGVNETYDTPDFGDSAGTEFSWFQDCSSDVADDGTKWMAQWANRMMLQVRRAVMGMGIPLNEVDGDSLYKAIFKAHRPIVNIGAGAQIHKGEKMPEWQHELRTLVGTGAVTCTVVGDTIVIDAAGGGSETPAASIGTGHPIYKGVVSGVRHFRSLLATHGLQVVANADDATVRLAAQPGWSIMLRNGASADAPTGVAIDELTEETTPSLDDWFMLQRATGRALRKVKRRNTFPGLKGLVALAKVEDGTIWTAIFGCSFVSSGLGTAQFALDTPLAAACTVVPSLSFATAVHTGDGAASQRVGVGATSTTHFNVTAIDSDGNTQVCGYFAVYG